MRTEKMKSSQQKHEERIPFTYLFNVCLTAPVKELYFSDEAIIITKHVKLKSMSQSGKDPGKGTHETK